MELADDNKRFTHALTRFLTFCSWKKYVMVGILPAATDKFPPYLEPKIDSQLHVVRNWKRSVWQWSYTARLYHGAPWELCFATIIYTETKEKDTYEYVLFARSFFYFHRGTFFSLFYWKRHQRGGGSLHTFGTTWRLAEVGWSLSCVPPSCSDSAEWSANVLRHQRPCTGLLLQVFLSLRYI